MAEIKRKSQGDKNNSSNLISLGNSFNNLANNRIKSKIKETPKDILYGSSNTNNQLKLKQDEYKSKLLDILGNHATQGDVPYGKPEELEEKIKQYGLENKLQKLKQGSDVRDIYKRNLELERKMHNQITNNGKQIILNGLIGKYGYASNVHNYVKTKLGSDTAGMLDLAHEKRNEPSYIKDAIELKNFNDLRVASDKKYLIEKLYSQFQNEYTKVVNIENIKGYFFKNNSEPSQRIALDSDFRKVIKQNKNKILNGQKVTMVFPNYGLNTKSNLHFALGHVDIQNGYIDDDGNLRIKIYDTYDFNKRNPSPINQAGRNRMLAGSLKPFFTIHDIIIPKSDIDKLWE